MDIYLPNDGEGPFPVIMFAHGGGFYAGTKNDYETYPPLEGLKRGYAVCAINYTLSGEAIFPRQVQEGKAALRFIRAKAAHYNLDPSCVIGWGMSAGANLVAMLATTGHEHAEGLEDDAMGNAGYPVHLDACMIWFCPTDFTRMREMLIEAGFPPGPDHLVPGDNALDWYLGIPVAEAPDLAALANPETFITPACPPFVIQHGKQDAVVPWQQSVIFADKLGTVIGPEKVRLTLFDDYVHADRRFETMHVCSGVLDDLEALLGRGQG